MGALACPPNWVTTKAKIKRDLTYSQEEEWNCVVHGSVKKAKGWAKAVRHENGQPNYAQADTGEKRLK